MFVELFIVVSWVVHFSSVLRTHVLISQLDGVQPRFEVPGSSLEVTFSWTDTLAENLNYYNDSSFQFERANLLYNMAAIEVTEHTFAQVYLTQAVGHMCAKNEEC